MNPLKKVANFYKLESIESRVRKIVTFLNG